MQRIVAADDAPNNAQKNAMNAAKSVRPILKKVTNNNQSKGVQSMNRALTRCA